MFGFNLLQTTCLLLAIFCSFTCACFSALCLENSWTLKNIKSSLNALKKTDEVSSPRKFEDRAIAQIKRSSYVKLQNENFSKVVRKLDAMLSKHKEIELAGLKNYITGFGLTLTRIQFSIFGGGILAIVGCLFSTELMLAGFLSGLVVGFAYPSKLLKRRSEERTIELEKHLPEMLEILSIGMRSGLSFDRSLEIYSSNFNTSLSREFANAQKLWSSGIKSRDCALRDITKGYDSMIFSRTIEALIRNLRLGTSVASSLLSASKEARANYQARREEDVRKAPIKMMIPTGTLILPAMLLLIMGPVILELAGGGV